ncbi:hypothetical protein HPHPP62_0574, partial [Helicobacter pylori Hp P-62]
KDFVTSEVAQNRARQFVKEIIGREKVSKAKNSAIKVSHTKASAIENETIGSCDLKKAREKIKADYLLGSSQPLNPLKTLFTEISIIMSKNY